MNYHQIEQEIINLIHKIESDDDLCELEDAIEMAIDARRFDLEENNEDD